MSEEKPGSGFKDFEEREKQFWWAIVEDYQSLPRAGYAEALLIRGNDRLKKAIEENREAIEKLRASMERSSEEANRLTSTMKKRTSWMVGLTVAAVLLAAVSLFVLGTSAR